MIFIEPCIAVYEIMRGFDRPWAIAGGWAIDLFLGTGTREHADVEIALYRQDQSAIRSHLHDWSFTKVQNGAVLSWERNECLSLPIHEIYAERGNETIEILFNECDHAYWMYRRDHRIKREFDKAILFTDQGIPYLSPEIVLLFKSKTPRPKDELDFQHGYGSMSLEQREWLQGSLKVIYKSHPWMDG